MPTKFTFGTDPEFFLYDTVQNRHISAHDKVPGDKANPFKLNKGAIQADGLAVEFNTDPAETAAEFADNVRTVLGQVRGMIDPRYAFDFKPTVKFGKRYIKKLPLKATELGCDPDYSARLNIRNENPSEFIGDIRTSSGHLHIGWGQGMSTSVSDDHFEDCKFLTLKLDNFWQYHRYTWDREETRHKYYGGNAAFRPKSYGVEYRGLSSKWLLYPSLWPELFDQSKAIFEAALDGRNYSVENYKPTLQRG